MEQVRDIPHHAMGDPWRYGYPDHSMSEPMSTSDEYGEVSNLCHVQNSIYTGACIYTVYDLSLTSNIKIITFSAT